jgi:hypothetical protein
LAAAVSRFVSTFPKPNLTEGEQTAKNLEEYRLSLIHERWLSTIILVVHLEMEAMLGELLRKKLRKPQKLLENKNVNLSFAHKLLLCEAVDVVDSQVAESIRAVNKLRNQLAHQLADVPTLDALARFITSMSAMHPLQVILRGTKSPRNLKTYEQIRNHFLTVDRDQLEQFVYVSLLLLRAKVSTLLGQSSKTGDESAVGKAREARTLSRPTRELAHARVPSRAAGGRGRPKSKSPIPGTQDGGGV